MEEELSYEALIVRRDSSARLCADALLRGDTAYALTKAIEFKDADLKLKPRYERAAVEDVSPVE